MSKPSPNDSTLVDKASVVEALGAGWRLDPGMRKGLSRFLRNRRALCSLVLLAVLFGLSLFSELLCNNRPIVMRFEGNTYLPLFKFYPGEIFGEEIRAEADYKALRETPRFQSGANWMLLPLVPYGPNESMTGLPAPPPTAPSRSNLLGTDDRGRDLLTRLVYGFRNSMIFALVSWCFIVVLAYSVGALQGFLGGYTDFIGQRFLEIWNALPVLYVILFLISVFPASLWLLALVWVVFGWIPLSAYVRAEVLRLRKMEFVTAARALGAGTARILFRHVLPNTLTPILTFSPFILSAGIGTLAALDYLGLGLPPPTASWGELLRQGKENLRSWWLAFFPFFALFNTLLLLNFIGEGVRAAFDTKAQAEPN